mmetsp:Transcript_26644/g.85433  ORF Transcript_26644/g.85433 Transcript_26644/m.85433 type:complete len:354 (-) Transcript_26644:5173-6234(-)
MRHARAVGDRVARRRVAALILEGGGEGDRAAGVLLLVRADHLLQGAPAVVEERSRGQRPLLRPLLRFLLELVRPQDHVLHGGRRRGTRDGRPGLVGVRDLDIGHDDSGPIYALGQREVQEYLVVEPRHVPVVAVGALAGAVAAHGVDRHHDGGEAGGVYKQDAPDGRDDVNEHSAHVPLERGPDVPEGLIELVRTRLVVFIDLEPEGRGRQHLGERREGIGGGPLHGGRQVAVGGHEPRRVVSREGVRGLGERAVGRLRELILLQVGVVGLCSARLVVIGEQRRGCEVKRAGLCALQGLGLQGRVVGADHTGGREVGASDAHPRAGGGLRGVEGEGDCVPSDCHAVVPIRVGG